MCNKEYIFIVEIRLVSKYRLKGIYSFGSLLGYLSK